MLKVLVYLDNCIVSDVVHRDPSALALWRKLRTSRTYTALASAYVVQEAVIGSNKPMVAARKRLLNRLKLLPACSRCALLAHKMRKALGWGDDRHLDALHVASASVNKVAFLITWDKGLLGRNELDVRAWLSNKGLHAPTILSPTNFLTRSNPPRYGSGPGRMTAGVRESRKFRKWLARQAGGDDSLALKILASLASRKNT